MDALFLHLPVVMALVLFCLAMLCNELFTYRYDGYDDSYNNASSSLTEEGSSPNGSSKGLQVGSHVIGTHRHRDVWNQQIKESNEKAKTQIKQGFKVSFCLRYADLLSAAATCCWTPYRCVGQIA